MGTLNTSVEFTTLDSTHLHSIPKLTANGSNWLIYKARIINTISSKISLKCHLNGTVTLLSIFTSLLSESSTNNLTQTKTCSKTKTKAKAEKNDKQQQDKKLKEAEDKLNEYYQRKAAV